MPKRIENVRERLIQEMEVLFVSGDDEVSLRSLAHRTGIGVGTIYNYFPDKDDLLKALFQRVWSRTIAQIRDSLDHAPMDPAAPDRAEHGLHVVVSSVYTTVEHVIRSHSRKPSGNGERRRDHQRIPYPQRPEGWRWLADRFAPIWSHVAIDDALDHDRLTLMVTATAHRLASVSPDTREENIAFLISLLSRGVTYT